MTSFRSTPYWAWIRSEAALIDTDGCSLVTNARVECCFEHDLAYYYAKDPRDAYRQWRAEVLDYWLVTDPIEREEADRRFRNCHQNRNLLGRYSPMALYRWLGVRWKAQKAWDNHRAREAKAAEEALFV
jgi:hypothetical protein